MKIRQLCCTYLLSVVCALVAQKAGATPESVIQSDLALLNGEGNVVPEILLSTYIADVRNHLPPDLIMRLPQSIQSSLITSETIDSYNVKFYSAAAPITVSVNLPGCGMGRGGVCSVANFSAYYNTSEAARLALTEHQSAITPIALTPNIRGYLIEGNLSSPSGYSSIMWEQGSTIYQIRFPAQDRQNLLYAAESMANAAPISKTAPVFIDTSPQTVISNSPPPTLIASSRSENSDLLNASDLTIPEIAQAVPIENDDASFDTETNSLDGFVPPLPADLDIDESGGTVLLDVIRPLPVLEFQGRSSVFFNQAERDSIDIDSNLMVNSAAVRATPAIGNRTRLESGFKLSQAIPLESSRNYNAVNIDLGVRHQIDDNMFVGAGWGYQKLSNTGSITGSPSENQIRLTWDRFDLLSDQWILNSNISTQASLDDNSFRNRLTTAAGTSLGYRLAPDIVGQFGYRLQHTDYFQANSNSAVNHQLGMQLTYSIDDMFSVGGSMSYLFGRSIDLLNPVTESDVDNFSFGLHLNLDFPISY